MILMNKTTYTLKISRQGQLTLPRTLQEQLRVQPGSRIAVTITNAGKLQISSALPIEKHFGTLSGVWTAKGQDASEYTRNLRNTMQPKMNR
jgi:bifunctional DNA-binding transcriptional regulator/antitoxin component of YhaV-PrlF toxin-antitoxin module